MKKDEKPDSSAVIDNYNFYDRQTYIQTWQLYDRPGPEGQVRKNLCVTSTKRSFFNEFKFGSHLHLTRSPSWRQKHFCVNKYIPLLITKN